MDPEESRRPLRILSLDGGGVRGLSSLLILQSLLSQDPSPEPSRRPCDVFDLICGTSAGGLIALMLGRLQMVYPRHLRVFCDSNRGADSG
jgi:patatin-like phospholipase/acyl hydrolase